MFTMALSSTSNQEFVLPGLETNPSSRSTFSLHQSSIPSSKKKFGRSLLHDALINVKNSNNFTNNVKTSINERQSGKPPVTNTQQQPASTPHAYGPPECLTKYLNLGDNTRKSKGMKEILESGVHLDKEEKRRMEMLLQIEKIQRM